MQMSMDLQEWFGGIDIYLFDQLLKGRITPGMKILDAGCGSGRNLVYFLRSGYEVFAVDESEEAIARVRRLAARLAPSLPPENFRVGAVERMSWGIEVRSDHGRLRQVAEDQSGARPPHSKERKNSPATLDNDQQSAVDGQLSKVARSAGFDVVLSSAVLHFARDEEHWRAMVDEMWRVLKPGGMFFARLASTIGVEDLVSLIEGRRYQLPDGSDRFLVNEAMLRRVTAELGGEFIEPLKTTVVENLRAMTTWVVRKG